MPQFTSAVEAQYADELRERRDMTDDEMAKGYFFIQDPQELSKVLKRDRKRDTYTRANRLKEAAGHAFNRACMAAYDAGVEALDGASVTITIEDLTATAVLTLPEKD